VPFGEEVGKLWKDWGARIILFERRNFAVHFTRQEALEKLGG
jgi:hypothetical protein